MLNITPKPGIYVIKKDATKPTKRISGEGESWPKPNISVIDPDGVEINDLISITVGGGDSGSTDMVCIDFEIKLIHEERAQQCRILVDGKSVKFVLG